MNRNKLALLITIALGVSLIIGILVFYKSQKAEAPKPTIGTNNYNQTITDTPANELAIRDKFNCDRLTDDVRESDVFCRFPELYPDGELSIDTVKDFYNCGTDRAYPICNNPEGLEVFRQEQIEAAKKYL